MVLLCLFSNNCLISQTVVLAVSQMITAEFKIEIYNRTKQAQWTRNMFYFLFGYFCLLSQVFAKHVLGLRLEVYFLCQHHYLEARQALGTGKSRDKITFIRVIPVQMPPQL